MVVNAVLFLFKSQKGVSLFSLLRYRFWAGNLLRFLASLSQVADSLIDSGYIFVHAMRIAEFLLAVTHDWLFQSLSPGLSSVYHDVNVLMKPYIESIY